MAANTTQISPMQYTKTSSGKAALKRAKQVRTLRSAQTRLEQPNPDIVPTSFFGKFMRATGLASLSAAERAIINRSMGVYDHLDALLGSGAEEGSQRPCVVAPPEQIALLHAFKQGGYFKQPVDIGDPADVEAVLDSLRPEQGPGIMRFFKKPPVPEVISWSRYLALLTTCDDMMANFGNNVVFVIVASTELGGKESGPWWCKGNFFTYLLFLRYCNRSVHGRLLMITPTKTDRFSMLQALQPYLKYLDLSKIIRFVHLLDGVYSGLEAHRLGDWWDKLPSLESAVDRKEGHEAMHKRLDKLTKRMRFSLVTPIMQVPSREWKGPIIFSGESEAQADSSHVCLYCAQRVENRSFLLPFKLADEKSLGKYYSNILHRLFPDFVAPYRQNEICNTRAFDRSSTARQKQLEARRLHLPLPVAKRPR